MTNLIHLIKEFLHMSGKKSGNLKDLRLISFHSVRQKTCFRVWRLTDSDKYPSCTQDKPFSCFFIVLLALNNNIIHSFADVFPLVTSKPNRSLI